MLKLGLVEVSTLRYLKNYHLSLSLSPLHIYIFAITFVSLSFYNWHAKVRLELRLQNLVCMIKISIGHRSEMG